MSHLGLMLVGLAVLCQVGCPVWFPSNSLWSPWPASLPGCELALFRFGSLVVRSLKVNSPTLEPGAMVSSLCKSLWLIL